VTASRNFCIMPGLMSETRTIFVGAVAVEASGGLRRRTQVPHPSRFCERVGDVNSLAKLFTNHCDRP